MQNYESVTIVSIGSFGARRRLLSGVGGHYLGITQVKTSGRKDQSHNCIGEMYDTG